MLSSWFDVEGRKEGRTGCCRWNLKTCGGIGFGVPGLNCTAQRQ